MDDEEENAPFSLEVILTPLYQHRNGESVVISETEKICKYFQDTHLVNLFLKSKTNFKLISVQSRNKDLLLTFNVFSQSQLDGLSKAVDDESIGNMLVQFAVSCGCEIGMGLSLETEQPGQLLFELDIRKSMLRAGKDFFLKRKKMKSDRTEDMARLKRHEHSGRLHSQSRRVRSLTRNESKTDTSQRKRHHSAPRRSDRSSKVNKATTADDQRTPEELMEEGKSRNLKLNAQGNQNGTSVDNTSDNSDREQILNHGLAQQQNEVIELFVYGPPHENITEVYVTLFDRENNLNFGDVPMRKGYENIWTCTITLPKHVNRIMYCYKSTCTHSYLFNIERKQIRNLISRSLLSTQPGSTELDIPVALSEGELETAFAEHVINVMFIGTPEDFLRGMKHIDTLISKHGPIHSKSSLFSVLEYLKNFIQMKGYSLGMNSFIILCYFLGKIFRHPDPLLIQSQRFTKDIAMGILNSMKLLKAIVLPQHTIQTLEPVLYVAIKVTCPKEKDRFFKLMEYCCPLLPYSDVAQYLRKQDPRILHGEECRIESVCNKIYQVCHTDEEGSCELILQIMRYSDIPTLLWMQVDARKQLPIQKIQIVFEERITEERARINSLTDIFFLWEMLNQKVKECLTLKIIMGFEETLLAAFVTNMSVSDETQLSIVKLITEDSLFTSNDGRDELLKTLARSQVKFLHMQFLSVLDQKYEDEIYSEFIADWTLKWFDTAIKHHGCKKNHVLPIEDLPCVYDYLGKAMNVRIISQNHDLIDKLSFRALTFLHKVNVNDLLDNVCKKDNFDDLIDSKVFRDHLEQYLMKGNQVNIDVILSRSSTPSGQEKFFVNTRFHAQMLALYIDASGTVQIEEDLDVFKYILRKWNIWSKLFSIEGKEKTIVINRPGYKRALSVATMMTEKIIDETVDIELLTTVEESYDAIKLMLAVQRKYNARQLGELLRSQKEHICSAKKDCEFLKRIFQQLVSIHQGRIPDLESMHDVYQKKERQLSLGKSIKLKELKDKSFWEPFSSILSWDNIYTKLSYNN